MNSSINSPGNWGVKETWNGKVSPERRSSVGGANSNGGNWIVSLWTIV